MCERIFTALGSTSDCKHSYMKQNKKLTRKTTQSYYITFRLIAFIYYMNTAVQ